MNKNNTNRTVGRQSMKVCHLAYNTFLPDARILKEAETLAAAGHDVTVLAIGKEGLPTDEMMSAVRVRRLSLRIQSLRSTRPPLESKRPKKPSRPPQALGQIVASSGRGVRQMTSTTRTVLSFIATALIALRRLLRRSIRYVQLRMMALLRSAARFLQSPVIALLRYAAKFQPLRKVMLLTWKAIRAVRYRAGKAIRRARRLAGKVILTALRRTRKEIRMAVRMAIRMANPRRWRWTGRLNNFKPKRLRTLIHKYRVIFLRRTLATRPGLAAAHWLRQRDFAAAVVREVRAIQPDVIHAHDLSTLPAGILAARKVGAALVYDAHEMEWECNRIQKNRWMRFMWRLCEAAMISAADAMVTVSPRIGELYRRRYRLSAPVIIPNVPCRRWELTAQEIDLRQMIPDGKEKRILLNLGNVTMERGIPQALAALTHLPNDFVLVTLGNVSDKVKAELKDEAQRLGVGSRLFQLPPVHFTQVANVAANADVGLVLVQPAGMSYRYCMPNKLFEQMHAGIPLVVGELPDVATIVRKNRVGFACDQQSPESIADAVRTAVDPSNNIDPEKAEAIRNGYSWETFEPNLLHLYCSLDAKPVRRMRWRRWSAWANPRNWGLALRSGPNPSSADAFAGLDSPVASEPDAVFSARLSNPSTIRFDTGSTNADQESRTHHDRVAVVLEKA